MLVRIQNYSIMSNKLGGVIIDLLLVEYNGAVYSIANKDIQRRGNDILVEKEQLTEATRVQTKAR